MAAGDAKTQRGSTERDQPNASEISQHGLVPDGLLILVLRSIRVLDAVLEYEMPCCGSVPSHVRVNKRAGREERHAEQESEISKSTRVVGVRIELLHNFASRPIRSGQQLA